MTSKKVMWVVIVIFLSYSLERMLAEIKMLLIKLLLLISSKLMYTNVTKLYQDVPCSFFFPQSMGMSVLPLFYFNDVMIIAACAHVDFH